MRITAADNARHAAPGLVRALGHRSSAGNATHNAGHERAVDSRCRSSRVRQLRRLVRENGPIFQASFGEGGGLKNPCTSFKKNAIGQVFTCRILTVCGEVAERLKAAVC